MGRALGLFLLIMCLPPVLAPLGTVPSASETPSRSPDSTGAVLAVQQTGSTIRISSLFVNQNTPTDTLAYRCTVRRRGAAGSSRSTQSGSFTTAPGQTDTLSTIQVSVQAGDTLRGTLIIRRGNQDLDTTHVQRFVP